MDDELMMRIPLILLALASFVAAAPPTDRPASHEGHFGRLSTSKAAYRPLEPVVVRVQGRDSQDTQCRIRVADPNQKVYLERDVKLTGNQGTLTFPATGPLGVHYLYLSWPGERRYSRYLNFRLDAETGVESGDRDFDAI